MIDMKQITLLLLFVTVTLNGQCWMEASAGDKFVIAIKNDGSIWSWGNSNWYTTNVNIGLPVQYNSNNNWSIIYSGYRHSLAIDTNNKLFGWGANSNGEIGIGTAGINYPAYEFNRQIGTDNWSTIDVGNNYSVAVKSDGTFWAWGENVSNTNGNWSTFFTNIPLQIGTDSDWAYGIAGQGKMYGLKTNGTLWIWKTNYYGQIGTDSDWAFITKDFAIKSNGTLWSVSGTTPLQIGTDSNWLKIANKGFHKLAIKTNGTLWAWGSNDSGQLGIGSTTSSSVPVQVGTDTNWQKISVGTGFSLGIKNDGTLWTWGANNYRQLGNGSLNSSNVPIQITCPNSLNIIDNYSESAITIYPNPVKSILQIDGIQSFSVENICIYDVYGKVIFYHDGALSQVAIDHLPSGIYFMKIKTDKEVLTRKFIKE